MVSGINSGGFLERRFQMIVSEESFNLASHWMRVLALFGALALIPLGLARAEEKEPDWEAIHKRIEMAVERGELTREEANKKHAEIRKRRAMGNGRGADKNLRAKVTEHFKKTGFTEEQIKQTWVLMERVMHELKSEGKKFELDPRMKEYIQTKVGLTEKQIESVVGVSRRMLAAKTQRGPSREEMAKVKEEIWAHVKSGKITEEQAEARWKAYLASVKKPKSKVPSREEMAAVKAKIWAGVKEGKITEAQAEERWQGYLKHVKSMGKSTEKKTPTREEIAKVKEEIWAHVKAGKITEEQAEARWRAYLEHVRGQR